MEFLKSLMQSVDDISHTIPDGTYLEMCNNLKSIHGLIPKVSDPPVTDNRSKLLTIIPLKAKVKAKVKVKMTVTVTTTTMTMMIVVGLQSGMMNGHRMRVLCDDLWLI